MPETNKHGKKIIGLIQCDFTKERCKGLTFTEGSYVSRTSTEKKKHGIYKELIPEE